MTGLVIDNFAGGGGASTGIEQALGRAVDIAINHDEEAIRMHEVNHPGTRHIRNNIWQVDPLDVCGGRPVELAWFSPDCKHFSKAKGGKPSEKSIRDLAWVVVLWGKRVKPALILLENVEEFRTWGPLDHDGQPIKERAGETFAKWCGELRKLGYRLEFRELRACDYGVPTIRKRFFMIARCDGLPIVWPEPTYGPPDSPEVLSGKRLPWRTAAEIIDWSIPCPSIFERERPLAEKTLRRIAHGIMKFVVNNPKPFIVPLTHHGSDERSYSADDPLVTVTGANRGELAIATPYFARPAHGDVDKSGKRRGQPCHGPEEPFPTVTQSQDSALITPFISPVKTWGGGGNEARSAELPLRTTTMSKGGEHAVIVPHVTKFRTNAIGSGADVPVPTVTANSFIRRPGGAAPLGRVDAVLAPLGMVMAQRNNHGLVTALLAQFNTNPNGTVNPGHDVEEPVSTIATKGPHQGLVTSNLVKLRGTCAHGQPTDEPLHTVSAGGNHMAEVRAFLIKYFGTDQDPQLGEPLHTVTSKDRFGLVTVTIEGEEYVIVDIGMRMLTPRELFNAQGFPADYIIDRDAQGRPTTKTSQVARCGNSVCPPLARAITAANAPSALAERESEVA